MNDHIVTCGSFSTSQLISHVSPDVRKPDQTIALGLDSIAGWLRQQPEEKRFTPNDPRGCVIAWYLRDLHRNSFPSVVVTDGRSIVYEQGSSMIYEYIHTPMVIRFIREFDKFSPNTVSQRVALLITDEVMQWDYNDSCTTTGILTGEEDTMEILEIQLALELPIDKKKLIFIKESNVLEPGIR